MQSLHQVIQTWNAVHMGAPSVQNQPVTKSEDGKDFAIADWCPWCDKEVRRGVNNACPNCGRLVLKKKFEKPVGTIAIWNEDASESVEDESKGSE